MTPAADPTPYDALLLLSFGGPEHPDEVMPFLQRVTAGRGVPPDRLAEVAEHYLHFGGRSPINDQNRALLKALEEDLTLAGMALPLYWGNRNSEPFLPDTLRRMAEAGVRRAAVFVTSVYSSYSGCRQYRENLAAAVAEVEPDLTRRGLQVPVLDKLRHSFDHPGFAAANGDALVAAVQALPPALQGRVRPVFVTHAIPTRMLLSSGPPPHADPGGTAAPDGAYAAQHRAAARAALRHAQQAGWLRHVDVDADVDADPPGEPPAPGALPARTGWDLVYCSRSGPPHVPWSEPDVNDHLTSLADAGVAAVLVAPIGFVSDHMEVIFDLDTEAAQTAERRGLTMVRAGTSGTHPAFVAMIRELVLERAAVERGESVQRPALSPLGPLHDRCPAGCCPNLRQPLPALCGSD